MRRSLFGQEFAAALIERARAGVRVHVMLDWWGSDGIEELHLEQMRAAGIEVRRYNPPRLTTLARMNNRTHRKLLVVDGSTGFTGGVGIADAWRGHAQDPQHWRDTHFRVAGPVVTQMQSAFLDNWIAVTGRVLHGTAYLPPLEPSGPQAAQVFTSAPGGGAESMQFMYLMSIAAASTPWPERSVRSCRWATCWPTGSAWTHRTPIIDLLQFSNFNDRRAFKATCAA